jgi:DNA-binding transcriptional regulator YhcF (GntR family)
VAEHALDLTERIRNHIIGALHIGDLSAGDRLPSIRQVARSLGEDERRVARAYRALETEGLVEVRGRSGVYAASQSRVGGALLEETAEWLAQVMLEGWTRRVTIARIPDLIRRYSMRVRVRCAFLDSCEDAVAAFTHELEEEFGMQVTPIWLDTLPPPDVAIERFPSALREADLVVSTIFRAAHARLIAERFGSPMITVRVHPQAAAAVIARLRRGTLTVVCADPSFGERIRLQYADHVTRDDHIRVVLADDADAVARLDPSESVMLTRAARRRVKNFRAKMLMPHSPTLSPDSALELLRFLVRANSAADEVGGTAIS